MRKFILVFCICLATTIQVFAINDVPRKESYLLNDCIKTAIKNSPVIKDYKYKLLITGSDVSIAKSNYFPTLTTGVGYWQGFNTEKSYDDGYTKQILPSVGVYIDQLIYDFGKTNNFIDMQKFYKNAAEYRYVDSICNTINDIKMKYFLVLEAQYAVDVEENNLYINKLILDETKKLCDSGERKQIDYINAQVYYSSAQIALEQAKNIYNNALEDLYKAMYITDSANINIVKIDTFDYYDAYFSPIFLNTPKGEWHKIKQREYEKDIIADIQELPFDLNFAQKEAFENSPDIKALEYTLLAMKKANALAKKQCYPELRGRVGYEYNSRYKGIEDLTTQNHQLNVAVHLDTSVNALKYAKQRNQAEIRVQIAENDIEKFKITLLHDVKKCYIDVETAQKQISNARYKANKALENLELTGKEYFNNTNGIGYLDLQNARQNYNSAKLEYIEQLKNYNISLAKLERITHIHNIEYYRYAFRDIDKKLLPKDLKKKYPNL